MAASGSDSGRCSRARPCRTFDRAYQVAAPGATIQVGAGTYPGQPINPRAAKRSAAKVVFRPAPEARVVVKAELDVRAAHLELRGMTIEQVNFLRSADDVTLRNIDMLGFFVEGSSNVSIIGGRVHCGVCAYHSRSAPNGRRQRRPPRNILIDGVLFEDWHAVIRPTHRVPPDRRRHRDHDPQLHLQQCATANAASAPPAIHISWYGFGPVTANVLLENNFIYASGNSFTIQANDFDNLDLNYNSIAGPIVIFNRDGGGTGMDFIGNNLAAPAAAPPKTAASRSTGATTSCRAAPAAAPTATPPTASSTATPTSTSPPAPPLSTPATPATTPAPTSTATPAHRHPRRRRRRTLR